MVQTCIEQSKQNIFNRNNYEDANYIRFHEFNESVHREARLTLLSEEVRILSLYLSKVKCNL